MKLDPCSQSVRRSDLGAMDAPPNAAPIINPSPHNNSCQGHPMAAVSSGILQGDFPLHFALPLLTLQVALVLLVTRAMAALFKPMKQPRVLAEIIGGVLLGPTALGRNKTYMETVFPAQSLPLLETVANIGLMFFIFMVGLELDLRALRKTGKEALLVGVAGIAVPFGMSAAVAKLVQATISKGARMGPLVVFLGIPMSISAFSVLVRIMAEVKLVGTEVGKVAVAAAAVNDVTIWTMLAVGVAMAGGGSGGGGKKMEAVWVVMSAVGFGVVMVGVVRIGVEAVVGRAMHMMNSNSRKREEVPEDGNNSLSSLGEGYVCLTMVSVMLAGCFSDALGVHPLLGPFLLGLIVPKSTPFPRLLTLKLQDFVTGLLLPLFFASSGLKTNLASLHGPSSAAFLLLFFSVSSFAKLSSTFLASRLFLRLPPRPALLLSFLMNTKGLGVLIVLNIGRDLKALSDQTFAILVVTCLLTTCTTTPIVTALTRRRPPMPSIHPPPAKLDLLPTNHTSCTSTAATLTIITKTPPPPPAELRILSCAHHDVIHMLAIANLLEACRASSSSITLHALRLLQLSDRPSDIFDILSTEHPLMAMAADDDADSPSHPHHHQEERHQKHQKKKTIDELDDAPHRHRHEPPPPPQDNPNDDHHIPSDDQNTQSQSTEDASYHPQYPDEQQQPIVRFSFHDSPHLCKVDVTSLTAIAYLHSLHHDICKLAAVHQSSIILLPHVTLHDHNTHINQRVLDLAPCSVGIVVDKSSFGITSIPMIHHSLYYNVLVLFLGGDDDREALAFASRMIYHPRASVKVLRFIDSASNRQSPAPPPSDERHFDHDQRSPQSASEEDEISIKRFRALPLYLRQTHHPSFTYEEHEYERNPIELLTKVVSQTRDEVSMFIVGRRRQPNKNDECDNYLGSVANAISAYVSSPRSQASVLVIQSRRSIQHVGNAMA